MVPAKFMCRSADVYRNICSIEAKWCDMETLPIGYWVLLMHADYIVSDDRATVVFLNNFTSDGWHLNDTSDTYTSFSGTVKVTQR